MICVQELEVIQMFMVLIIPQAVYTLISFSIVFESTNSTIRIVGAKGIADDVVCCACVILVAKTQAFEVTWETLILFNYAVS